MVQYVEAIRAIIKEEMREQNLNQKQLAQRIPTTSNAVHRFLKKADHQITVHRLCQISSALKISPSYIVALAEKRVERESRGL